MKNRGRTYENACHKTKENADNKKADDHNKNFIVYNNNFSFMIAVIYKKKVHEKEERAIGTK